MHTAHGIRTDTGAPSCCRRPRAMRAGFCPDRSSKRHQSTGRVLRENVGRPLRRSFAFFLQSSEEWAPGCGPAPQGSCTMDAPPALRGANGRTLHNRHGELGQRRLRCACSGLRLAAHTPRTCGVHKARAPGRGNADSGFPRQGKYSRPAPREGGLQSPSLTWCGPFPGVSGASTRSVLVRRRCTKSNTSNISNLHCDWRLSCACGRKCI